MSVLPLALSPPARLENEARRVGPAAACGRAGETRCAIDGNGVGAEHPPYISKRCAAGAETRRAIDLNGVGAAFVAPAPRVFTGG